MDGAIKALAPADAPGRTIGPLEALARALADLPPAERCAGVCYQGMPEGSGGRMRWGGRHASCRGIYKDQLFGCPYPG